MLTFHDDPFDVPRMMTAFAESGRTVTFPNDDPDDETVADVDVENGPGIGIAMLPLGGTVTFFVMVNPLMSTWTVDLTVSVADVLEIRMPSLANTEVVRSESVGALVVMAVD